jgi:hypothetical protein
MKGGNRNDFISQVDQLIAVRHGESVPRRTGSLRYYPPPAFAQGDGAAG